MLPITREPTLFRSEPLGPVDSVDPRETDPRDSYRLRALVGALPFLATWWAWHWIFGELVSQPQALQGLLPLGLLTVLIVRADQRVAFPRIGAVWALGLMLMLAQICFKFTTPLIATGAAIVAAVMAVQIALGRSLSFATIILGLLILPLGDAMDFYFGYPMRMMATSVAAGLLRLQGLPIQSNGAMLEIGGNLVAVDVPCAGVSFLWLGIVFAAFVSGWVRLSFRGTIALLAGAATALLIMNAVRVAALFQLEHSNLPNGETVHEAIGVVLFCIYTGLLAIAGHKLAHRTMRVRT